MDETTRQIAAFAAGMGFADLPPDVVAAARTRVVDAIGCAYGGYRSPTVEVSSAALGRTPGEGADAGLGWQLGRPSPDLPVDAAAFLNTAMIRYLDFNDWFPGGHPSDTVGALLAFAGAPGVTGQRLLTAAVVSYETSIRIARASGFRRKGFDQGLAMGIGTAAALGTLLGLDADTIAEAIGILAASGIPTRATRSGHLSMWKGCATAYATRNAAFVTLLVRAGMTGPPAAFDGRNGIKELVTGPFDLEAYPPDGDYFMPRSSLKFWPVCGHLQAAIWAGLELRTKVDPSQLAAVDVGTYWEAWRDTGSEPDKWDPQSRETADHSLPYALAWSFVNGPVGDEAFAESAYLDPTLRPLMSSITVAIDDEVEAAYPDVPTMRVKATTVGGEEVAIEVARPSGHPDNPLSESQVLSKFVGLAAPALGSETRARAVFRAWWDALTDTGPLPMRDSAWDEPA